MLLTINKKGKETVFRQIFNQITELINSDILKEGSRLPSTRDLAFSTGVNRTTIIRVYEELWAQGYVESTPGSYTRVRKRNHAIVTKNENDDAKNSNKLFNDSLDLEYEPLIYYIENGKSLERGKINFLQLSPDSRLLEKKMVKSCMKEVMNETGTDPFNYTHARGYEPLRNGIARHMKLHNINVADKNILITNGSLQSLQLIFQTFSKPGDMIITEAPTNSVLLHIIKIFKLNIIDIPVKNEGIDLRNLTKVLKEVPVRFIYTMPTFHNPTGVSMPQAKREEFLNICREEDCIIIEDSIEEEMIYTGKAYLPLKAIDHIGQVIYLGTFAKVLAPGLKTGWIIAGHECIKKLTVVKTVFEISSGTISQILLSKFIEKGAYELHLRKMMRIFRKRMRVAIVAVKRYISAERIEWREPSGGYMIWIKLLTDYKEDIEKYISENGVMVHNGKYFFAKAPDYNYIRICISQTNETEIEEGIRKIGEAIMKLPFQKKLSAVQIH